MIVSFLLHLSVHCYVLKGVLAHPSKSLHCLKHIMLVILDEDVFVACLRDVGVNVKLVVAHVGFEDQAQVAAFVVLFQL